MTRQHNPLVSIVVPCYNAESWVAAAIESALGQAYRKVEVIVIDDGSTDRSLAVIKQFDGKLNCITTTNRGPSAARNLGLRNARGEWIQFLDADDLLHRDRIGVFVDVIERNSDVEFVYAPHLNVSEDFSLASIEAHEDVEHEVILSRNAFDIPYLPWAGMFRASFLKRVGDWNESLRRWVDLEYHARIAVQLPLHARLSEPLYFYRHHGGQRISNSNRNHSTISEAIDSLTITRTILETSEISPANWKPILWTLYLYLALSAIRTDDQRLFIALMRNAADLRADFKFHVKSELAVIAARLFGPKLTANLIDRTWLIQQRHYRDTNPLP